jgi:hypothetical protein
VEAIVFKLEIINYELRTKTANIKDPTFNGALGTRDKTKHLEVAPHFLHKDASDSRGVDSVLTVRRLRRTLPGIDMRVRAR